MFIALPLQEAHRAVFIDGPMRGLFYRTDGISLGC